MSRLHQAPLVSVNKSVWVLLLIYRISGILPVHMIPVTSHYVRNIPVTTALEDRRDKDFHQLTTTINIHSWQPAKTSIILLTVLAIISISWQQLYKAKEFTVTGYVKRFTDDMVLIKNEKRYPNLSPQLRILIRSGSFTPYCLRSKSSLDDFETAFFVSCKRNE